MTNNSVINNKEDNKNLNFDDYACCPEKKYCNIVVPFVKTVLESLKSWIGWDGI